MVTRDRYETAKMIGDIKRVQEFGDEKAEAIDTLKDMIEVQSASIIDDYMRGLYNGMEFARSILEGDEPQHKGFEDDDHNRSE